MKEILYVVMPAYNEEENIEKVVRQWYPILEGKSERSRLVIADKGSTDKTHEILAKLQKTMPQLEIYDTKSQYHGPKVIALYDYAIKNGAAWVFQTDSDGQTNPKEFDGFWNSRNQFSAIFGVRSQRGDGMQRAFVENVVCLLLRLYFDVKIPDANAPFRLIKVSALKKYLYKMDEDFNIPNIMITTFFSKFKETICFREISFKPRTRGRNSINIYKIIKIGWKALGDFGRYKREMQA